MLTPQSLFEVRNLWANRPEFGSASRKVLFHRDAVAQHEQGCGEARFPVTHMFGTFSVALVARGACAADTVSFAETRFGGRCPERKEIRKESGDRQVFSSQSK